MDRMSAAIISFVRIFSLQCVSMCFSFATSQLFSPLGREDFPLLLRTNTHKLRSFWCPERNVNHSDSFPESENEKLCNASEK